MSSLRLGFWYDCPVPPSHIFFLFVDRGWRSWLRGLPVAGIFDHQKHNVCKKNLVRTLYNPKKYRMDDEGALTFLGCSSGTDENFPLFLVPSIATVRSLADFTLHETRTRHVAIFKQTKIAGSGCRTRATRTSFLSRSQLHHARVVMERKQLVKRCMWPFN